LLIITHYQRILHLVQPSHVHVMFRAGSSARVTAAGDELEAKGGYGWITDELEQAVAP